MLGIVTVDDNSVEGIGAAFHIGDGILVTARHVIEDRRVVDLVTNLASVTISSLDPIYPDDPNVDLAVIRSDFSLKSYMEHTRIIVDGEEFQKADHIQIGGHLDDWIDDGLVLMPVVAFGYPLIPLSSRAELVAVRGEINAVVDPYIGSPHPLFIISPLARGGFSGGPVLVDDSWLLGIVTSSLITDSRAPELGYHAVLSVEPLWNLLFEHRIFPATNIELMYALRHSFDVPADEIPLSDETKRRIDTNSETLE